MGVLIEGAWFEVLGVLGLRVLGIYYIGVRLG